MQGIKCLKGCGASIEDIQEYCRLCLVEETEENLRARIQRTGHQKTDLNIKEERIKFSLTEKI